MGLIEHANTELEMSGLFSENGDFYGGATGEFVYFIKDKKQLDEVAEYFDGIKRK